MAWARDSAEEELLGMNEAIPGTKDNREPSLPSLSWRRWRSKLQLIAMTAVDSTEELSSLHRLTNVAALWTSM